MNNISPAQKLQALYEAGVFFLHWRRAWGIWEAAKREYPDKPIFKQEGEE